MIVLFGQLSHWMWWVMESSCIIMHRVFSLLLELSDKWCSRCLYPSFIKLKCQVIVLCSYESHLYTYPCFHNISQQCHSFHFLMNHVGFSQKIRRKGSKRMAILVNHSTFGNTQCKSMEIYLVHHFHFFFSTISSVLISYSWSQPTQAICLRPNKRLQQIKSF